MDEATVERRLRELPEAPSLAETALRRFKARRRRIGARHRQWRANMPALDTLFDDDAHRAKALAGNAATEAHETLSAWADAELEVGGVPAADRRRLLLAEMDSFLTRWRQVAPGLFEARDWEASSRPVFDEFLEELLDRGRADAEERLRGAGRMPEQPRLTWLGRPLAALARLWQRVFEPTGAE